MFSADKLFQQTSVVLEKAYGKREAQSLAFLLLENVFALTRSEILAGKQIERIQNVSLLDNYLERLQKFEPVQYILGSTEFYGYPFQVNPSVLIPRQETEELVQLIISENKKKAPLSIIDIGTGSGCIAITLKKELPQAFVYAADISKEALAIAQKNAVLNNAEISFLHKDILSAETIIPETNIIVSNPPYVMHTEKKLMAANVLEHEPHLALFVEEENPLIFYAAIAEKAKKHLLPGGRIYFEINEQFGKETAILLSQSGFKEVRVLKDLRDKDRMVRGEKAD
jgi:release factor glutamine methyltransferase